MDILKNLTRKKLLARGMLVLGILAILYFISNYSLVRIEVDSKSATALQSQSIAVYDEDGELSKLNIGSSKRIFMHRGEHTITASNDREETQVNVSPGYFLDELIVPVEPQASLSKIASESQGCATTGVQQSYSWNCESQPAELFEHVYTGAYPVKQPVNLPQLFSSVSYKSGVLGITYEEETLKPYSLKYIDFATNPATVTNLASFATLNDKAIGTGLIVTDNDTGNSFVLIDEAADVFYYFASANSQPTEHPLPLDSFRADRDTISYSLHSGTLYYYGGYSESSLDDHSTNDKVKKPQPVIKTVDIEHDSATSIDLDNDFLATNFYSTGKYIVFQNNSTIRIYRLDGETLRQIDSLSYKDGASVSVVNSEIYVIKDNSLYLYSPETRSLRLLFNSLNYTLSSMEGNTLTAFFNGEDNDQILETFSFNSSILPKYPRLEDAIPIPSTATHIRKIDYLGNTIYIQLILLSYITDRQLGQILIDETEYQNYKQEVLQLLSDQGITDKDYSIIFSY